MDKYYAYCIVNVMAQYIFLLNDDYKLMDTSIDSY